MEAVTNINLKSQFLETELIWVVHWSHRAYDWRDIISSEDSSLVRMTTNNYHMLSLCIKYISIELFHTKYSSGLFASCYLLPSCTIDSKQQANNLLYSKYQKHIFNKTQRNLFPIWIMRNHKTFFFFLPWKVNIQMSQAFCFILPTFYNSWDWKVKLPST